MPISLGHGKRVAHTSRRASRNALLAPREIAPHVNGEEKSQAALGFLTVLEHDQQGLVGGYLLLNASGRPLEFHCTAPVKANRAQQILFGPTLAPYLYGEQIGQTLVAKGSIAPLAVCTDIEQVLCTSRFRRARRWRWC